MLHFPIVDEFFLLANNDDGDDDGDGGGGGGGGDGDGDGVGDDDADDDVGAGADEFLLVGGTREANYAPVRHLTLLLPTKILVSAISAAPQDHHHGHDGDCDHYIPLQKTESWGSSELFLDASLDHVDHLDHT